MKPWFVIFAPLDLWRCYGGRKENGRILLTWRMQLYRITIRATDESVPPMLMKFMEESFSQGIEFE